MKALEQIVQKTWPTNIWGQTRILVAISGGADSVALLRCLLSLAPQAGLISAAHYNHGWRGQASDRDEHFVSEMCARLGVPLQVGRVEATAGELPNGTENRSEDRARNLRYAFLARAAYQCGARYVASAHTASDRVETLLHNLFRGTGLAGASSPTLLRDLDQELVLVRPMLACTRHDVEAYLQELEQPYCTDASNQNVAYRRNFIRHELLPHIRKAYGQQADERILSFSEIVEESYLLLQSLASEYLRRAQAEIESLLTRAERNNIAFAIPNRKRLPAAWPVVRQALVLAWYERGWTLQKMGRDHWNIIRGNWELPQDSADTHPPTINLPGNLSMCCYRDMLLFTTPQIAFPNAHEKTRSPGHENNKD